VKVKAEQVESLIAKLPDLYQKYDAENPLEYGFVDEQLDKLYQGEQRIASILFHFCILSIFITCLGLLGLATFDAEQRTKEIGIRKVLGASASSIVKLLSVDFVRLILVGVVIGIPIAWWSMNQWLSNFAYHTTPEWWVFAASALLAGIIGFFTIAVQVMRVASTNPTESLKSE
jgi:ABC-type antimicrobial peptide transport system permease subunit